MCSEIMAAVSGGWSRRSSAVLRGFRRRCVACEVYPAVVDDDEEHVDGAVYWDVPDAAWERLDRFEGELYTRRSVLIVNDEGREFDAEIYVLADRFRARLSQDSWSFAEFLRRDRRAFIDEHVARQGR